MYSVVHDHGILRLPAVALAELFHAAEGVVSALEAGVIPLNQKKKKNLGLKSRPRHGPKGHG